MARKGIDWTQNMLAFKRGCLKEELFPISTRIP